MKYEKPMVINLSARARATGQDPLSCTDGNVPMGGDRICGSGTSAQFSAGCASGNAAGDCASGLTASFTCLPGPSTALGYECGAGSAGALADCTVGIGPNGCTSGAAAV